MNDLQLFNYEDNTVRTIMIDGEVWFVAKDVCDILGLSNPTEAIRGLDDDEKNTLRISEGIPGRGNPNLNVINEPGLYALVFKSNKPEAKQFSKWVRTTVLPQLNHTGSFSMVQNTVPIQIDPIQGARVVLETAHIKDNQLTLALDKVYKSYTGRSALQMAEIELVAPVQEQLLNPTQIGKFFGVSARKINQILTDNAYQRKIGDGYEPLEAGEPYAVMLDVNKWHDIGTPTSQLKWRSSIVDELSQYFN